MDHLSDAPLRAARGRRKRAELLLGEESFFLERRQQLRRCDVESIAGRRCCGCCDHARLRPLPSADCDRVTHVFRARHVHPASAVRKTHFVRSVGSLRAAPERGAVVEGVGRRRRRLLARAGGVLGVVLAQGARDHLVVELLRRTTHSRAAARHEQLERNDDGGSHLLVREGAHLRGAASEVEHRGHRERRALRELLERRRRHADGGVTDVIRRAADHVRNVRQDFGAVDACERLQPLLASVGLSEVERVRETWRRHAHERVRRLEEARVLACRQHRSQRPLVVP